MATTSKKKSSTKNKKAVVKKDNKETIDLSPFSNFIMTGDMSKLTENEKMKYYVGLCKRFGLDPLTKPFDYIIFERNGERKEILYANKNCAEQLRLNNGISIVDMEQKINGDICIVTVKVQDKTGRTDVATGAVSLTDYKGNRLTGGRLADAIMKCETKAKRRATLSIAGLGLLDETELDFVYNYKEPKEVKVEKIGDNTVEVDAVVEEEGEKSKPIDTFKRQDLLEKYKRISSKVKAMLTVDRGMSLDEAIEYCEKNGFDDGKIINSLIKEGGDDNEYTASDDFF